MVGVDWAGAEVVLSLNTRYCALLGLECPLDHPKVKREAQFTKLSGNGKEISHVYTGSSGRRRTIAVEIGLLHVAHAGHTACLLCVFQLCSWK